MAYFVTLLYGNSLPTIRDFAPSVVFDLVENGFYDKSAQMPVHYSGYNSVLTGIILSDPNHATVAARLKYLIENYPRWYACGSVEYPQDDYTAVNHQIKVWEAWECNISDCYCNEFQVNRLWYGMAKADFKPIEEVLIKSSVDITEDDSRILPQLVDKIRS